MIQFHESKFSNIITDKEIKFNIYIYKSLKCKHVKTTKYFQSTFSKFKSITNLHQINLNGFKISLGISIYNFREVANNNSCELSFEEYSFFVFTYQLQKAC